MHKREYNTTGSTQYYMHPEYGLLERRRMQKYFRPSILKGDVAKIALENRPYRNTFDDSMVRIHKRVFEPPKKKVQCKCGEYFFAKELTMGLCRTCFCVRDPEEDKRQQRIEYHAGHRSSGTVERQTLGLRGF